MPHSGEDTRALGWRRANVPEKGISNSLTRSHTHKPKCATLCLSICFVHVRCSMLIAGQYSSAKCIWIGQLLAGVLFFFGSLLCGVL